MNIKRILKQILFLSPTYRKVDAIVNQNLELKNEIEVLKNDNLKLNTKLSKLSQEQLTSEKLSEIVDKSTTNSIINNAYIFNSAVSNMLESHLYNSSLKTESKKTKPLFLLGSGPSLKDVDISKLKNCYTMSFNRSYIAFKDWGFEPTYFAGIDTVVNEDNEKEFKDLLDNSKIERFFFSRTQQTEDKYISTKTTLVQIGSHLNPNLDFTKRLRTSNTGLFGLQVALGLLGFKEVYLLGCDANYNETVEGVTVKDNKYVSESNNDSNHFRTDYFGKGKSYNKPNANLYHLSAWEAFYNQVIKNNKEGFKVYNCSKSGKLQFFPYQEISTILESISQYEKDSTK